MADSIASMSDSDLLALMDQLKTAWTAAPPDYPGITAAMKSAFDTLRDLYNDKIHDQDTKQSAAKAATAAKNATRDDVEASIRNIRAINKAGGVSEDKMAALGIPSSTSPAPPNATVPVGAVDTSGRMKHTISFTDLHANGNKKKPRGAVGCEIWVKIDGPPPGSEKDCTFLALDTQSPYVAEYAPTDANKTAHYMLRWQLRDGTKLGWGDTVSATITA
jgi:hypothetical protein